MTEAKAGKIEYRLDKTEHHPLFPSARPALAPRSSARTSKTVMGAIVKAKPAAAKGQYIKSVTVATTMGPGVKVNGNKFGA